MTEEKNILPKWFVNLLIGIAITVISAMLVAGIFALLDVFENKNKIEHIEQRMEKFEKKQDAILSNSNITNEKLAVLVFQIQQMNDTMKELKSEVRGSFTSSIEHKKARFKTLKENLKIAGLL